MMKKEGFDEFICLTCVDNPEFKNSEQALIHITKVHGYQSETHGTRDMRLHLDGSGFFETDYEWDFGTFKLYEKTGVRRVKVET